MVSLMDRIKIFCTITDSQFNSLNSTIKSQPILDNPKILGSITGNVVTAILGRYNIVQVFLSDSMFDVTSKLEAETYQVQSLIQDRKWISEKHDCDNFSYSAMGYWSSCFESFSFGIAWSKTHAFNIMIDNEMQLWILEPQKNEWFKYEDRPSTNYDVYLVLM